MQDPGKRWSARKKAEIVLRLLRGEAIDALSRENEVTVGMLSQWRDEFIEAGIAGLKGRSVEDVRLAGLEKKIGQQAMEIELYKKKRQWNQGNRGSLSKP
jgi:transposase-like protein